MFRLNTTSLQQLLSSRWLAAVVLFCALQATFLLWVSERQHAENLQAVRFKQSAISASEAIQHRVDAYRQILKGVEQLYISSEFVSAEEFRLYVDDYLKSAEYGSLNAIGFIKYINLHQPETFKGLELPLLQKLRKLPEVKGEDELAPLLYVEPRNDANSETLLKNTFVDKQLRANLLEAGDGDRLVMSGHFSGTANLQRYKNYILHAPVYRAKPATIAPAERRHQLNGWVFLRFDVRALLAEALHTLEQRQLYFEVYDMSQTEGPARLYYSAHEGPPLLPETETVYGTTHTLNVNGQVWRLSARSTPAFEAGIDYRDANEVGVLGVVVSLLLAGLVHLKGVRTRTRDTLQRYDQALSSSEQRWKVAMESTGDGVWDWNVTESRVMFSEHWKKILGFAVQELDTRPETWHQRIHADDATAALDLHQQVLAGEREQYAIEYRMLCKDGSWKWVFDRGTVLARDAQGKPTRILGTLADVSKIKQSEEVVWQFANVDTLTGLPNRRLFFERLDQALHGLKNTSQKLALVFLDLDRFKEVNDTQGHDQGDKLLLQAGRRLSACVGNKDLIARLGGDEFVLMLSDANAAYVEALAQRVLEALAQPFQLDETHAYVSASLGIAIFPDDAANKEDLMKRVDQAMYASKQRGGNCFTYFTPRMQQHAEHRMRLSHDLRQAIADQEFFLEYQPVVDLQTHAVVKAEALVRWQHPVKGLIPPMEFIGIAEDNLLIVPIGEWVFKTAIAQCVQWRDSLHGDFQIAINKSPVQFAAEHRKHEDWLTDLVKYQQPGNMVVVEITERLLLDASTQVSERLSQYQQAGVQVALDDFGTGYSALSYLKKFPINYVKIDRSFVHELGTSSQDEALCRAIIVMAHSLGMRVVAEGIENQRQLLMLQEMGCDYGQGYYFSPPLRPEAFERWHANWQQHPAIMVR